MVGRHNATVPQTGNRATEEDNGVDWDFLLTADSMLPQVQVEVNVNI